MPEALGLAVSRQGRRSVAPGLGATDAGLISGYYTALSAANVRGGGS